MRLTVSHKHNGLLPFCTLNLDQLANMSTGCVRWLIQVSHRCNFVCDGGDMSPPLLNVVVTLTTTFGSVIWKLLVRTVTTSDHFQAKWCLKINLRQGSAPCSAPQTKQVVWMGLTGTFILPRPRCPSPRIPPPPLWTMRASSCRLCVSMSPPPLVVKLCPWGNPTDIVKVTGSRSLNRQIGSSIWETVKEKTQQVQTTNKKSLSPSTLMTLHELRRSVYTTQYYAISNKLVSFHFKRHIRILTGDSWKSHAVIYKKVIICKLSSYSNVDRDIWLPTGGHYGPPVGSHILSIILQ